MASAAEATVPAVPAVVQGTPAAPTQPVAIANEPPLSPAKPVDATLGYFEALQASQAADAKAFHQLMEKRLATMAAMRAMQSNDVQAFGQLESTIRQTREGLTPVPAPVPAPVVAPIPVPAPVPVPVVAPIPVPVVTPLPTPVPVANPEPSVQSAQQLEILGRLLSDLNRDVKQLADKVEKIQK